METQQKSQELNRERLEKTITALEAQRAILGDEATDAAIASLRRQISDLKAAEKEPDQRMDGERRVVTILFCDVVGSTALAEQMDPEDWTEIMNAVFERLIEPVERYGGTVSRLMGDAVLAFFGAPIAHEDDPQRAVLAGLGILDKIRPFREKLKNEDNLSFDVRVGINTGLVVVGDVGSDTAAEYTAMGDAVNLAARMEQTAQPGTVQIAENTYRLVAPLFEFEALGGIAVKGKAEPVQSYRVLERKARPGRTRGIEGLESPLIGRVAEKERLLELIAGLQGEGEGAIVILTGEAGLGKSRLLRELSEAVGEAYSWYEAASLSFESRQPYSMFQSLIRRLAGATSSDSKARLSEQLESLIAFFPSQDQDEILRLFQTFFGLSGQSAKPSLEGEAFQKRLFTAMEALFEEQMRLGPLILVLDDLQWADPASTALLQHLVPLVERGPLLLLLAMRPDSNSPGWKIAQTAEAKFSHRCTSIRLQPLNSEEGGELVNNLLAISDLPPRLRILIQEKTEGNPFFIEEVVRLLIDDGLVVRDDSGTHWQAASDESEISIPGSVLALLAARIDRLEQDARKTLQVASVVGRSFYYRVLTRVVDLVDDVSTQLQILKQTQFIQEAARQPELEYIFRHALTQEAAYEAILRRQRRGYHLRVGEALESLFPDRHEEFSGILAFHFFQARDYQRALQYYTVAGDNSYRLYAVVEAIDYFSQAIDCALKVETQDSKLLIHLFVRKGRAYKLNNQHDRALENYQRMMELAEERDDKALRLASLTAQCILRASGNPLHDPGQAKQLGAEALLLARELGDPEEESRALWGLQQAETWSGNLELGLSYGEQSLAIARDLGLTQQIGYTLHTFSGIFMSMERFEEAKQASLEEREAWLELGNTVMLADSYLATAGINLFAGDFQAVIEEAEQGYRLARSIDSKVILCAAPYYIGLTLFERGEFGPALKQFSRGLAIAEAVDIPWFMYGGYAHLARLYQSLGALDRADPLADLIYENREKLMYGFHSMCLARSARIKLARSDIQQAQEIHLASMQDVDAAKAPLWFMAEVIVTGALINMQLGNPELALSELSELVARTRSVGMKIHLTEALLIQGQILVGAAELEGARIVLQEAANVAEEIGQLRLLWRIFVVLAKVEARAGNSSLAKERQDRAREIIDFIAGHTGDEELRETFVAQPEVRSILERSG